MVLRMFILAPMRNDEHVGQMPPGATAPSAGQARTRQLSAMVPVSMMIPSTTDKAALIEAGWCASSSCFNIISAQETNAEELCRKCYNSGVRKEHLIFKEERE